MYYVGSIPLIVYPFAAGAVPVPPPLEDDFLLLDGTDFLLLDGTNFLLLG